MPLSSPTLSRTPQHIRKIHLQSYLREDGLWDLEGELLDVKAVDSPQAVGPGIRKAGDPIHHMLVRLTIDPQLTVQAVEVAMDAHPVSTCPHALPPMQGLVGCSMARGWRKAVETQLGNTAGCTHIRELLMSMATAAFQSIVSAFQPQPDQPPAYLGRCAGWEWEGAAVAEFYPQFLGWPRKMAAAAAPATSDIPTADC